MISDLIKKYEGCRLSAYKDAKGIWTIGWGNIRLDGLPVQYSDVIIQEKADKMLADYIQKEIMPTLEKLPSYITNRQKEALASLIYNWNAAGFLKSKMYQAILRKDKSEIIRQWDFGFKDNLNGLFKRRTEEVYIFFQDIEKW